MTTKELKLYGKSVGELLLQVDYVSQEMWIQVLKKNIIIIIA